MLVVCDPLVPVDGLNQSFVVVTAAATATACKAPTVICAVVAIIAPRGWDERAGDERA